MIELNLTQLIVAFVAVFGAGSASIWGVGRFRNGNSSATLAETRHQRVVGLLGALEIAIIDLGKAVTELRIEVAKRD